MCAVPLALPFERYAQTHLTDQFSILIAWALVEELLKYVMAASFILWRRAVDETPDYVIYMITAALGFAAAENMLFLLDPLARGAYTATLLTGNLRFLGSTLLHVIASAIIGLAFAFSATRHSVLRTFAAAWGLILAIALHTTFNALMIKEGGSSALSAFFLVWVGAVGIFAAFEVLKYFQYRNQPNESLPT
jgi:RsiW-degrading membrane proteinase PrsW (M82 family)